MTNPKEEIEEKDMKLDDIENINSDNKTQKEGNRYRIKRQIRNILLIFVALLLLFSSGFFFSRIHKLKKLEDMEKLEQKETSRRIDKLSNNQEIQQRC